MKLKISWLWIPFLIIGYTQSTLKTMGMLFLMLSIHEGAHMIVAYLFRYPIEGVVLYPFGLCAKMRYIGMGNILKEALIIMAGPAMHFILIPPLLHALAWLGWFSPSYLDYLLLLNHSILIFNILPVFPLDGGRIMQSLYHLAFRYTTAQRCTLITSVVNLFLLFHYQILTTWSAYVVMFFLFFQIVITWKQLAQERLQFYHYRKNHPVHYPMRYNHKHDLFRANTNLMRQGEGWIMEEDWLKYYFHDNEPYLTHTIFL